MLQRQRGAFNLVAVGILSALFAAAAMAALFSIRAERNLFAEGLDKARQMAGDAPGAVVQSAKLLGASESKMRRCVIDGKKVMSNTECLDNNPTSKDIKLRDSRGFEAPKKPVTPPAEVGSNPSIDKMIEKQLQ